PSVETLLHAALPAKYIDHTHADAILAIADQDDAENICKELFGDGLVFIPYVMPGFGLARVCKKTWDWASARGRHPTVMILERHGIFTFGASAKESYERMIGAVSLAERYIASRGRAEVEHSPESTVTEIDVEDDGDDPIEALAARVGPMLRGALAMVA